jgi:hypothetical protein
MQGIPPNRPLFHENLSRKRLQIRQLEGQIPYADEQGIYLREQGIVSAFWTGAGNLVRNRSVRPGGRRGSRFLRVEASIDSRGAGRVERSARRFLPEPSARRAALTGGAEKAIEALGNPDSGFGNGFARSRMR